MRMKQVAKKCAGGLLVISGVAFGFVPLIPGIVLIILGLELLGLRKWVFKKLGLTKKDAVTPTATTETEQ